MKSFARTACAALAISTFSLASAIAQDYPSKPVRIVVGYSAGGATDTMARLLAQRLSTQMNQQFIVANMAGANGNIAADHVARSTPDGLTLYMGAINNTINASLYDKLPFDFVKDFSPISRVATVPNILVVHPSVPVQNVKELIALAKAKPGKINFASSGTGSSIHMSGELFKLMANVDMVHIPYKGSAPAVSDLIGGQVQVMFDNAPSALPHVKGGNLRALAVTGATRSPALPDVPTMNEAGVPGFQVTSWFALFAPANTSKDIVQKLSSEVNKALKNPALQESLGKLGADPAGNTPEQLTEFVAAETAKWAKVVKASGAKVE
ncbi:MAG: tripartite tricarboxylate transporter substrate binding protein [Polaromonas sp.]|nr:tripartite tricarboxylate transporter substrate binding protein [Polaromonas sp.]